MLCVVSCLLFGLICLSPCELLPVGYVACVLHVMYVVLCVVFVAW